MIASTLNLLRTLSDDLTVQESLSGIFGSISLATWIFLLVPQLYLNYTNSSAEGISLAFLLVWLVGDITNLAGAVWANLVPTVIALAIYFCIADFVLISQCVYYNEFQARKNKTRGRQESLNHEDIEEAPNDESPLLGGSTAGGLKPDRSLSIGLPGSNRRSSVNSTSSNKPLSGFIKPEPATENAWVRNTLSIVAVIIAGTAGWSVAWISGAWQPIPVEDITLPGPEVAVGAEVLGYISAVAYLGARLPQIYKNYSDKSCDGLALLFFLLSVMGNITYGLGILCHSLEKQYIMTNLPWLIGSLGTVVEDVIIFVQFRMYAHGKADALVVE